MGSNPSAPVKKKEMVEKMASKPDAVKKVTPAKFVQQVKQEWRKVTLPTRRDTVAATGMVLVMVTIAAIFFFISDWIISTIIETILGI